MNEVKEKIYRGLSGLASVLAGETCENPYYMEMKKDFRYPGEFLERMEEKGYASLDDYISVMYTLPRIQKYHTEATFVGKQLDDFLVRAAEKAVKENSLLLLYQVLVYDRDGEEHSLSNEDKARMMEVSERCQLKDVFLFLEKLTAYGASYWKRREQKESASFMQALLYRAHCIEVEDLSKLDVLEHKELFLAAIKFAENLYYNYGKEIFAEFDPDLGHLLEAYADMYEEPVSAKHRRFLKKEGYSDMNILNLNCGLWFISAEKSHAERNYPIKWWKMEREWFQELFRQDKEITFPAVLEQMLEETMPRRIDGKDLVREFLLCSFHEDIPVINNSYLLFHLLVRKIDSCEYRCGDYNKRNRVYMWNHICSNHKLSLLTDEDSEWTKGLVEYLTIHKQSESLLQKTKERIGVFVLEELLPDQKLLDKKNTVFKEIFGTEIKEFMYSRHSGFNKQQLNDLFESGYLSFLEFAEKAYHGSVAMFLKQMNAHYQLAFMKEFCESRNWVFTDSEADLLRLSIAESWVTNLAYYRKDDSGWEKKAGIFSDEELALLLGLTCELCTRIPSICDLENLMAGYIAHEKTRNILGDDLSRSWYEKLESRNYLGMEGLIRDFLPKEEYEEAMRKAEEKQKEKKIAERNKEIAEKESELLGLLAGYTTEEQYSILAKNIPVIPWYDSPETYAVLNIYKKLPAAVLKKNICEKFDDFLVQCCGRGVITRKEMIELITKMEELENDK